MSQTAIVTLMNKPETITQVRDGRIWLANEKAFRNFRTLRNAWFFGLVACELEGIDDSYEYEPTGLDLRKDIPRRVIFDGQPTKPWRAAILWRDDDFVAYFGDPMFGESHLRRGSGAKSESGPDLLAEKLFDRPLPHLSEREFSAWTSEQQRISKLVKPSLERALAEGLLEVSGIEHNQKRGTIAAETFRSRLKVYPHQDTIVAGRKEITAVKIRLARAVSSDAKTTFGAKDRRDYAAIVKQMEPLVAKGMSVAKAAEQMVRRKIVVARKPDALMRSITKPLIKAYRTKHPDAP